MAYDDETVEVTWRRGVSQQNKVTKGDMGGPTCDVILEHFEQTHNNPFWYLKVQK